MIIRYAIEKEIEVPDNYTDLMIDDEIQIIQEKENGLDSMWEHKEQLDKENCGLFYLE